MKYKHLLEADRDMTHEVMTSHGMRTHISPANWFSPEHNILDHHKLHDDLLGAGWAHDHDDHSKGKYLVRYYVSPTNRLVVNHSLNDDDQLEYTQASTIKRL